MFTKALLSLILTFSVISTANAQVIAGSNSLFKLLAGKIDYVMLKPINPKEWGDHWLIPDDTISHSDDRYGYKPFEKLGVGVKILREMLANSQQVDTTEWTLQELGNVVLIERRDAYLSMRQVLANLTLANKAEVKDYRRLIRRFNNTNSPDRDIYQVSRPVFDNSGRYAAVIVSHGASGLSGGGRLVIFEKKQDGWYQIGMPKRWAY
ncbi:hypothetical protein [Hymenobacter baengnokdamensis]|uniref:hypothetical protein n=1 Tax=Hymenobacter baengnokdamensis TaxID=2615203 RepID=UPI0012462674|nr:hypothetical protein [Hymenobacter baengnokdamensis]